MWHASKGTFLNLASKPVCNQHHNESDYYGRSKSRKVIILSAESTRFASDASISCRKRKLTDKTLPNAVLQHPDFAADSKMYQDLLQMERKLDWTMTRKKVEVQDALVRTPTVRAKLRRKSLDRLIHTFRLIEL